MKGSISEATSSKLPITAAGLLRSDGLWPRRILRSQSSQWVASPSLVIHTKKLSRDGGLAVRRFWPPDNGGQLRSARTAGICEWKRLLRNDAGLGCSVFIFRRRL